MPIVRTKHRKLHRQIGEGTDDKRSETPRALWPVRVTSGRASAAELESILTSQTDTVLSADPVMSSGRGAAAPAPGSAGA